MNKKLKLLFTVVCIFFLVFTIPICSFSIENKGFEEVLNGFEEDDQESEDALSGFDEEVEDISHAEEEIEKTSVFSLDGYFKIGTAFNIDNDDKKWRGLIKLRTETLIELNVKLSDSWQARAGCNTFFDFSYDMNGRSEYTSEILDNYEKALELREVYILGSLSNNLDIKFGRQIVVWGKSDNIRVTDILNPLNMQEPGLTDIEDLRLSVVMTRIDYYKGQWNLTTIAVHENRYNKNPEFGSDFYVFPVKMPEENTPANDFSNTEFAAALNGTFSGWDIALYYANIYNDTPHLDTLTLQMEHGRIKMGGIAFNTAYGNWLFKSEVAYFSGIEYSQVSGKKYSRTDVLIGAEYSGISDTTIGFEVVDRHQNNYEQLLDLLPMKVVRDEVQTAIRITRKYMNDTLTLTMLASFFGETAQHGAFERISTGYDLSDTINIACGVILYQAGDTLSFKNIDDNTRIFMDIKYNF